MSALDQLAREWITWTWSVSWQFALFVGVVAIVCRLLRSASPRLRHALWLLCLLKIVVPPSLAAPWGIGHWSASARLETLPSSLGLPTTVGKDRGEDGEARVNDGPVMQNPHVTCPVLMMGAWVVGTIVIWGVVCWRYWRLRRAVKVMPAIDEGPLRIGLEQLAQKMRSAVVPDLHVAETVASPYLLGVLHPRIVLPRSLIEELDAAGLETVLLHELIHWQRRDTWVGWGQIFLQGLLWFHPLAWWAGVQLRIERENACDDAVVRFGSTTARQYGEVILRVLTASRGRSYVAGSLVGVFERGTRLQQRLEDVMSYDSRTRTFGWGSWLFLSVFALLFLPMGRGEHSQTTAAVPQTGSATDGQTAQKTPYPVIVETKPEVGETGISASLSEIQVVFDRDMSDGMSWTGGPPLFPSTDESRKPYWVNNRTCVLPVKLKRGQFYRVGINSTSYQNFKSTEGVPTPSSAIYFTTQGASKAIARRVRVPEVLELDPANNATDVDPDTSTLRVTFNQPMGGSFSWTGGGETFPEVTSKPYWSKDAKTCTLPVKLKPEHEYRLGLNSLSHINFQSQWGVPLKPVAYAFQTRGK